MNAPSLDNELPWGLPMPCGDVVIAAEDVVKFGTLYDPLPFHVDHAAARESFFGGLVAPGAQIAAAATALARGAFLRMGYSVGRSLGVEKLELLRPLLAGETLRAVFTIVRPRELKPWIGVISQGCDVAECQIEAFDSSGGLVMRCQELLAIGYLSNEGLSERDRLNGLARNLDFPRQPRPASSGSLGTCLEDCREGVWFGSGPRIVLAHEQADFEAEFGSTSPEGGNDWHGFSYAVSLIVEAMWRHGHPVAGAAVERLRWGSRLRPGQRLYCDVFVRTARPSRSRPNLGVLSTTVYCSDADHHLVCQFDITSLVRRRATM